MSVIVPVYNDPQGIRTTLDSLLGQRTAHDYRVHVVDNGSTDRTPDVVRSFDDERVRLHHERGIQSSYAARNTGVRNADGEVLAFVDADMHVPEDWLSSALDEFEAVGADYMGCRVELTLPPEPTLAARYDYHTGFPVERYLQLQQFAPTCCLFVRRSLIDDVGGFAHRLTSGGDKEFGNRVHDAGYDLHYASETTMYHPTRNSLRSLITKDLRVGRGLCQLQRYSPDRYGVPGIPPRPTGVKRPDHELDPVNRFAFATLSTLLTGVRGLGYYREFVLGNDLSGDEPGVDQPS